MQKLVDVETDRIVIVLSAGGTIELSGVKITNPDHVILGSFDHYQLQDAQGNVIGSINLVWRGPGYDQVTNAIEVYQRLPMEQAK